MCASVRGCTSTKVTAMGAWLLLAVVETAIRFTVGTNTVSCFGWLALGCTADVPGNGGRFVLTSDPCEMLPVLAELGRFTSAGKQLS